MTSRPLPHELRSLVHHIELNKRDWWNKALQQVTLYVLWLTDEFSSAEQIAKSISQAFAIEIDLELLSSVLQDLKTTGRVVESEQGNYKITEEQRTKLIGEIEDAEQIANQAQEKFIELLTSKCPGIDPEKCWDEFNQHCLLPLVMDMGARTYQFMLNGTLLQEMPFDDTGFFTRYDSHVREPLRAVILQYLAPGDDVVREFILRTLDVAFFLEASGLQAEALEKLASSGAKPKDLTLFLDTNLLFSVMDLHENPSNQSVRSLFQVMDETSKAIQCTLYALPTTVEEFKRTLIAARETFKDIPLSPSVVAASQASRTLSGLNMRYMEACQRSGGSITPNDYFNPYITNPAIVMRTKGVDVLNESLDNYEMRQDVVNGINAMWESEAEHRKTDSRLPCHHS